MKMTLPTPVNSHAAAHIGHGRCDDHNVMRLRLVPVSMSASVFISAWASCQKLMTPWLWSGSVISRRWPRGRRRAQADGWLIRRVMTVDAEGTVRSRGRVCGFDYGAPDQPGRARPDS